MQNKAAVFKHVVVHILVSCILQQVLTCTYSVTSTVIFAALLGIKCMLQFSPSFKTVFAPMDISEFYVETQRNACSSSCKVSIIVSSFDHNFNIMKDFS
jgi:hypothetical protein